MIIWLTSFLYAPNSLSQLQQAKKLLVKHNNIQWLRTSIWSWFIMIYHDEYHDECHDYSRYIMIFHDLSWLNHQLSMINHDFNWKKYISFKWIQAQHAQACHFKKFKLAVDNKLCWGKVETRVADGACIPWCTPTPTPRIFAIFHRNTTPRAQRTLDVGTPTPPLMVLVSRTSMVLVFRGNMVLVFVTIAWHIARFPYHMSHFLWPKCTLFE